MPATQRNYDYYEYGDTRRGTAKAAPRLVDSKRTATASTKKATSTTGTRRTTATKTVATRTSTTKRRAIKSDDIVKKVNNTKATNRASVRAVLNDDIKTTSRKSTTRATTSKSTSKNLDVPNIVRKKQLQKPKEMSLKNAEVAVTAKQKAKAKAKKRQNILQNIAFSLCCFSILFLICYRSSVINEYSKEVNSIISQLERVNAENGQIRGEINNQIKPVEFENRAKYQLGMQKPKDSQIQRIMIEKEDKISTPVVIEEEEASFWTNFVNDIKNVLD